MNAEQHLVYHGLAIKKYADATAVADLLEIPLDRVTKALQDGVARGSVMDVGGRLALAPTARVALQSNYGRFYASLRANAAFLASYQDFERLNVDLKGLITDWQTMRVGGSLIPNDHSNPEHDEQILTRLSKLHERAERVLKGLAAELPRMGAYLRKLEHAFDRAEAGEIRWVSDAKIDSYHTAWFELHEDLLCLLGQQRQE